MHQSDAQPSNTGRALSLVRNDSGGGNTETVGPPAPRASVYGVGGRHRENGGNTATRSSSALGGNRGDTGNFADTPKAMASAGAEGQKTRPQGQIGSRSVEGSPVRERLVRTDTGRWNRKEPPASIRREPLSGGVNRIGGCDRGRGRRRLAVSGNDQNVSRSSFFFGRGNDAG